MLWHIMPIAWALLCVPQTALPASRHLELPASRQQGKTAMRQYGNLPADDEL
jgi:hypothetical protein